MFTEWGGNMDWPLDPNWECEVCGYRPLFAYVEHEWVHLSGLEWGIIHGLCRCTRCHSWYNMRDHDNQRVTKPILLYKKLSQQPLEERTDDVYPNDQPDWGPEPPQEFEPDPMNPCGAYDPRF